MSDYEDELNELEQKMISLKGRIVELEVEAGKWKAERDRLNELGKVLREESLRHREKRDNVNSKVAEIRGKIEELKERVREKREYLEKEGVKLEGERVKLPQRRKLADRLSRIEWEIMTTPTLQMIEKENELISEVKALEEGLTAHEKLDKKEDEEFTEYADIKALEMGLRNYRNEIDRLRAIGADNHEKMINLRQKAEEEKKRADEAHTKFKEQLEAKKVVLTELNEIRDRTRELRSKLGELDRSSASRRGKSMEERKKELQTEAKRKFDAGEKLSLEELKLVYEDEEEEDG